jgi:hypothetical protein
MNNLGETTSGSGISTQQEGVLNLLQESGGNLIVSGNLQVDGSSVTVNSSSVRVDDPVIVIGADQSNVVGGIAIEHAGSYSSLLRTTGDTFILTKNSVNPSDLTPLNSLAVSDLSTASHSSVDSVLTTLSTLANIKFIGPYDATGSPNSSPVIGDAYVVTTPGTHSITSQLGTFNSWSVGDWLVNTPFGWSKVDNTVAVGLDLFELCENAGVLVTNQICEVSGTGMISVAKGTAYNKDFGTVSGSVLQGDAIDFKATLNLQENNINLNTLASSSVVNIHTMIIVGNILYVSSGVGNSGVSGGLYIFDIGGTPKFLSKIEANSDLDKSFIARKIGKFIYNANANSNNTGSSNTYIDVSNPSSPVILNSSGTKVPAPPVSIIVQYAQNVVGAKYNNSVSVYPLDTLDRISTELKNYVLSPVPSTGNAIQDLRTDGTSIIVFTAQFLSSTNPTENHVWIIDMVAETITRQAITATDGHNTIWDYNPTIKGQTIAQDGSIFYTIGRGGNNSSVLNVSRNDFSDKSAIIQTHLKSTSSGTATAYSFATHFPRICTVAGRLYICRSDGVIEILNKDTLAFVAEITPSFVATTMVVRADKLIIGGANLIAIYDIAAFSPDNISTNLILAKELSIVNNCSIGNQLDVGSLGVSKGLFVSGSALIDDAITTDTLFVTDIKSRVTSGTIIINDDVEMKDDLTVAGDITVSNVYSEVYRGPTGSAILDIGTLSAFTGNVTMSADVAITGELVVGDPSAFSSNLNVGGNLVVTGDLTINGTTTSLNVTEVDISDPILLLGKDNPSDSLNLGLLLESVDASTTQPVYHGLIRKPATEDFYLFRGAVVKPTTTSDPSTISLANLYTQDLTCSNARVENYFGASGTAKLSMTSALSTFTGDVKITGELQVNNVGQDTAADSFACITHYFPSTVNIVGDKELVATSGIKVVDHNMTTNIIVGTEVSFTIGISGLYELGYNINATAAIDSTFCTIGFILNGAQTGDFWNESSTTGRRMAATAMENSYQNFKIIRALSSGDVIKPRVLITGGTGIDLKNYSFNVKRLQTNL